MKPVLLLIPGMFNTPAIWEPVAGRLREQVDIRIADVSTQDSMGAMAADAWRLVADLAPDTPLIVSGYSMGGYVAIELLATHHAGVQGAAFVDSSACTETPETLLVRHKTIAALERNFAKAVEGTIVYSLHPDHQQDMQIAQGMRSMMHAVGATTAIRQMRALMQRADHRAMLAGLRMPVLVACGRADRVTPPELSIDFSTLVTGARLEWIEQAGHHAPVEQPAVLAQLLLSLVHDAGMTTKSAATPARLEPR